MTTNAMNRYSRMWIQSTNQPRLAKMIWLRPPRLHLFPHTGHETTTTVDLQRMKSARAKS